MLMKEEEIRQQKIILFDGICNLCNGSVTFILKHEKEPAFRFASIQSEAGREILEWCGLPGDFKEAIVFSDRGTIYLGSTAALKIGQHLKFPWSLLSYAGFIIPRFVRDRAYRQIAQHRYQWFGKRVVCMVPTENLKARFLEE
jgi:predicted DCC family thiol-disulfide oxidoreductase YuxK